MFSFLFNFLTFFLLFAFKAVCQSKKSWQARHTGIKIVQQIAILMGCAVLPHLRVFLQNNKYININNKKREIQRAKKKKKKNY